MPLFGIETEYGIAVEGKGAADLVEEARSLVQSYKGPKNTTWYYRGEDPRNDMRGFRVDRLSFDPEDAQYDQPTRKPLPAEEERADQILVNGARFYNDHGHPEFSTPECSTLLDIVTYDKVGERIVLNCAKHRTEETGDLISVFKNNTDFHGSSYGTHENYLMPRFIPFEDIARTLYPFFATRILFTGAGKIGIEPRGDRSVYQISQRADFFTELASVDTLYRRPIINTRDEPHADPMQWRRLHVICGDANMSEYATALKIGTTYLTLSLIEDGWRSPVQLKDPVQAIKDISRDQSYKWLVTAENKGSISAIEIQRLYLEAAKQRFSGRGFDTDWTLRNWEDTLNALERDPFELYDRLDWVAKRQLLSDFIEAEGLSWSDETLASYDLAYTNIDPDEGLYYALEQSGQMIRLTTDDAVESAVSNAPNHTRAAIRGAMIEKFGEQIGAVGWNKIVLRLDDSSWMVDLDEYLTADSVDPVVKAIQSSNNLTEFIELYREVGK